MKSANVCRSKGQVYSVGNYLMTGKVLGKGHFARVEEATHRVIGKKVAIKIIDLTSIKEEYARRNLHREPRVMAKLRHPCIAALYETMMHGPRLYVVMEAACGGDLCSLVLGARGATRGLPESRARPLAAQLVSAVKHMHAAGVVHRDLKMENIMLDSSKTLIKIVDFGLSNLWSAGGSLRTPCGSLEYAAPELFAGSGKYGPEVDLWSIGVIVYGMVTGGLPFTGEGGEGRSRPQLRAAIARGFTRKQRNALHALSLECKAFIQHLLEPNVQTRMRIEEASRHRWVRRPGGLRMKTYPLGPIDLKLNREIYRQISELCGQSVLDVVSQIRAEPYGAIAGIYNLKSHLASLGPAPGPELLWSAAGDTRPLTPPDYHPPQPNQAPFTRTPEVVQTTPKPPYEVPAKILDIMKQNGFKRPLKAKSVEPCTETTRAEPPSPRFMPRSLGLPAKPVFKVYNNGDCGLDPRLPCIDEHSNTELDQRRNPRRGLRTPSVKKVTLEEERPRLSSCPNRFGEKRTEFYRKAGDGLPSWRATGGTNTQPARILLQSNATTMKRASLGNIISPHSSTNSHCKSERAMPVGWFSSRGAVSKEQSHLQRFRRTATTK